MSTQKLKSCIPAQPKQVSANIATFQKQIAA